MFEVLKRRWETGTIAESMLKKYVLGGRITPIEYKEITGKDYIPEGE